MDKHISRDIKERLEGFPEHRIPSLIDYIEFLKQKDKAEFEKPEKTLKRGYFPEAGP